MISLPYFIFYLVTLQHRQARDDIAISISALLLELLVIIPTVLKYYGLNKNGNMMKWKLGRISAGLEPRHGMPWHGAPLEASLGPLCAHGEGKVAWKFHCIIHFWFFFLLASLSYLISNMFENELLVIYFILLWVLKPSIFLPKE